MGRSALQPQEVLLLALAKLDPRYLLRNPVMFSVEVGAVLLLLDLIQRPNPFSSAVDLWLWLTLLFAALAEALAEGRGRPRPRPCVGSGKSWWPSAWRALIPKPL